MFRVIGQVEGDALRLPAAPFRGLLAGSPPLSGLLKRYVLTVVHQAGRNTACNLRHEVPGRMCRWLLMMHDRAGRDEFRLTHKFFSVMQGGGGRASA